MTKAKELLNSCLSNIQKIHSALVTKPRSLKNEEDVREYQRYSYLITRYYKPLSKDQRNGISVAAGSFDFEPPGRYSRGYDFFEAASDAAIELIDLLEKAKYFTTKNNFKEAAAIAQSIIESIPRHYEMVDDSDGGLGDVFNDAIGLLLEIAENKTAAAELKKEIFSWVGKEVKENIYDDYGFSAIHSLLIPYTQAAGLLKELLLIANERIEHAANEYRLEHAVNDKIKLLQQNNCAAEAESVIDRYIHLVSIRKMRIDAMLEQNRHREAIGLIEQGFKEAENKGLPGIVCDWKDQLLEIYIVMADHSNIVKYAEELFYIGRDPMKYYHILKKEMDKEKFMHTGQPWAAYLDGLISKRTPQSLFGYTDNVLAPIYIEEQYWDHLLHLVEKADLSGLQAYEQYLKPRFPEQVGNLFAEKVKQYADRNMGRQHYQQVAGILKKIRSYPAVNEIVDKLLAEFKMKYKARRAMMEELRGM